MKNVCIDHVRNINVRRLPGTHNNKTRQSYHIYLKCILNYHKLERGAGYWKRNDSNLEKDYKQGVVDIFNNIDNTIDPLLKWESFMINVLFYKIRKTIRMLRKT